MANRARRPGGRLQPALRETCGWTTRDPAELSDCNDDHPDVHPRPDGEVYFLDPIPGAAPDRDYDYDCNGVEQGSPRGRRTEARPMTGLCQTDGSGSCRLAGASGWEGPTEPECGASGTYTDCLAEGTPRIACASLTRSRRKACR